MAAQELEEMAGAETDKTKQQALFQEARKQWRSGWVIPAQLLKLQVKFCHDNGIKCIYALHEADPQCFSLARQIRNAVPAQNVYVIPSSSDRDFPIWCLVCGCADVGICYDFDYTKSTMLVCFPFRSMLGCKITTPTTTTEQGTADSEAKGEAKSESKCEAEAEAKSESMGEEGCDATSESKGEAEAEAQAESKGDAEAKAVSNAERKRRGKTRKNMREGGGDVEGEKDKPGVYNFTHWTVKDFVWFLVLSGNDYVTSPRNFGLRSAYEMVVRTCRAVRCGA